MALGKVKRPADVDGDAQRVPPVKHPGGADALDDLGKAFAIDIFHGDPAIVAGLAGAVEGHEVWMPQRQRCFHGADEALHLFFVPAKLRPQDLQGDGALSTRVMPLEHHA